MTPKEEELQKALKGNVATFVAEYDKDGVQYRDINIVSKDILASEIKKNIRKGRVVVLREPDGSQTAYEATTEDVYDENAPGHTLEGVRTKYSYPNYGTDKQDRVKVKKFPWEDKK